jgi:hypothetical protein
MIATYIFLSLMQMALASLMLVFVAAMTNPRDIGLAACHLADEPEKPARPGMVRLTDCPGHRRF